MLITPPPVAEAADKQLVTEAKGSVAKLSDSLGMIPLKDTDISSFEEVVNNPD